MTNTALIFDKSPSRRRELGRQITATGCFTQLAYCSSRRETLTRLNNGAVDMIVYGTKRISPKSLSWLDHLSGSDTWLDIPVLAFSATEVREERIMGIEAGATDCFSFAVPERELRARIQRFLANKKRLEALRDTNERLARMAVTDPLTGIGNRRHFDDTLLVELKRNNRSRSPFALLMIDIDHFKRVNDTIGHQGGDRLLKTVADVLRTSIRTYDTVCRFGGEEFAIIMPDTSAHQALVVSERIRREVATINAKRTLGDFPLTVSIGLRCVRGSEVIEAARIVADADQALYRAKQAGRNRTENHRPAEEFVFTPALIPRFAPLSPALSL